MTEIPPRDSSDGFTEKSSTPIIKGLTTKQTGTVQALISEILANHPGVTGFARMGSAYDPESRLPNADIDINWCGKADESKKDEYMGFRKVFVREGTLIDLSTWFWSDLSRPESSGLATAISLARSEIIWDREEAFRKPRSSVRSLLTDRDWVKAKLAEEFTSQYASLEKWLYPLNRPPLGDNWDFPRHCCTSWGPTILSCMLVRPPSVGRKGLMETVHRSRELDVPWFGEAVLNAMGCSSITNANVVAWALKLERFVEQPPHPARQKSTSIETNLAILNYYLSGIQTMITQGFHREAIWPCWRAFHYLLISHGATETVIAAEVLRNSLGFINNEIVTDRLPIINNAVERLESHSEQLLNHFFTHLSKISEEWD